MVELVNLSAGGAMVTGLEHVMMWDHVGLVLGGEDDLDCAVRWIKGDKVGLEFAHETQLDCDSEARDDLLRTVILKSFPELGHACTIRSAVRRMIRTSIPMRCNVAAPVKPLIWNGMVYQDDHDYDVEPVRLRNISVAGALVQSSHDLPEGATVYLDLGPAGKPEAKVCWTRGGQSGLAFTEIFDVQQLAKARPEVAANSGASETEFGNQEPWARVGADRRSMKSRGRSAAQRERRSSPLRLP